MLRAPFICRRIKLRVVGCYNFFENCRHLLAKNACIYNDSTIG